MKKARWLCAAALAAALFVPTSLNAEWDVKGTVKKGPSCNYEDCIKVFAYSNADCTGDIATGICLGDGNYEICDISFEPKSIKVEISGCYYGCFTLSPFWANGSTCGSNNNDSNQTKNVCVISQCD